MRAEKFTEEERPMMERTSLHAYRLRLDHPVTEERMEFKAELPKDFQAVINKKLRSSVDKLLQQVAKKDGGKSAIHLFALIRRLALNLLKTNDDKPKTSIKRRMNKCALSDDYRRNTLRF